MEMEHCGTGISGDATISTSMNIKCDCGESLQADEDEYSIEFKYHPEHCLTLLSVTCEKCKKSFAFAFEVTHILKTKPYKQFFLGQNLSEPDNPFIVDDKAQEWFDGVHNDWEKKIKGEMN